MRKKFGFMGASSVLMIFIVLCLTAFGVLSLASASSDAKLVDKAKTATEEYYRADAKMEELIGSVDQILVEARVRADEPDKYIALLQQALSSLEGVEMNGDEVVLTVGVDENREIRTVLKLMSLTEEKRFLVTSRKLCLVGGEEVEEGINLWDGF